MAGHGARNPKDLRVVANVTMSVNDRIERLADAMGQNKGVSVAMCITAGLRHLERVYGVSGPFADASIDRPSDDDMEDIDMHLVSVSDAEKLAFK